MGAKEQSEQVVRELVRTINFEAEALSKQLKTKPKVIFVLPARKVALDKMTTMEMQLDRVITALSLGNRSMMDDQHFQSELVTCGNRVREAMTLLKKYSSKGCCGIGCGGKGCCGQSLQCCKVDIISWGLFSCGKKFRCCMLCRVGDYNGDELFRRQAESLTDKVKSIKSDFTLSVNVSGAVVLQGTSGAEVNINTNAKTNLVELDQVKVIVQDHGDTVAVGNIATPTKMI